MAAVEIVDQDHAALCTRAVELVFGFIRRESKKTLNVAVCGGRSIVPVLSAIVSRASDLSPQDWFRLQFFMVDERLVSLDDRDCNFKLLSENFFSKILEAGLINREQVHPFTFTSSQIDRALLAYQEELDRFGGLFDLVFLGVGEDAHVAALFPGSRWLADFRLGAEEPNGIKFVAFQNSPKPPSGRMSSSPYLIAHAKFAMALLLGEGKRQALDRYRSPVSNVFDCPAKLVDLVKEAYLLTDLS